MSEEKFSLFNEIDWSEKHILKIRNEITTDISDAEDTIKSQRQDIEPWLTAIFQSEHLSLLTGTGLTSGLSHLAGIDCQAMSSLNFKSYSQEIKNRAKEQVEKFGRGTPNLEDELRVAFELLRGLEITEPKLAKKLLAELEELLKDFIQNIGNTEAEFIKSEKRQYATQILKNFLISFSSRTASKDRLQVFTTNYDRFIEYGLDKAEILILDRFVGKIEPTFRLNRFELDYHYNPPGIRGEPRYVEGVVKYTKLHGSLDWVFQNNEIVKAPISFGGFEYPYNIIDQGVIYPNSSKAIETAFYPYSELFRDFSIAINQQNSVLVTYGYGFGDSHINLMISEMLRIPSTHLVIISFDNASGRIERFLQDCNLSQITLLIGDHLGNLENLVNYYLPKAAIDKISERENRIKIKRGVKLDSQEIRDEHS